MSIISLLEFKEQCDQAGNVYIFDSENQDSCLKKIKMRQIFDDVVISLAPSEVVFKNKERIVNSVHTSFVRLAEIKYVIKHDDLFVGRAYDFICGRFGEERYTILIDKGVA